MTLNVDTSNVVDKKVIEQGENMLALGMQMMVTGTPHINTKLELREFMRRIAYSMYIDGNRDLEKLELYHFVAENSLGVAANVSPLTWAKFKSNMMYWATRDFDNKFKTWAEINIK